jgi:hypothetical protein
LEQLTAHQLVEWEEYNKIDPVGEWRNDFKFALLLSTITNLMISAYGKQGSKLTKLEDFLIEWEGGKQEEKKQSVVDMKNVLLGLATASKGKKVRVVDDKTMKTISRKDIK